MAIINLISGPRNISTALMYSFAQRKNTMVLDEPYYAYYLLETGLTHPGRDEVMASQLRDKDEVTRNIFDVTHDNDIFLKNMSKHLEVVDDFPYDRCKNIFLIRNPAQIIASFAQVIESPTMHDIGLEYQWLLYEQLRHRCAAAVLDSSFVLENPEGVLRKACDHLEIDFYPSMLQWPAGPKPYDGVWAPYWYANVHQSTGFVPQATSKRPLPDHLVSLAEEAGRFYKKLLPFAIEP